MTLLATLLAVSLFVRSPLGVGAFAFVVISTICFGWATYVALDRAREPRPVLVISRSGVSDPTGVFMLGEVPWELVEQVLIRTLRGRAYGRVRLTLAAGARPEPLSLGTSLLLFVRSGSTPRSINLSAGAVRLPADLSERLRGLAPATLSVAS